MKIPIKKSFYPSNSKCPSCQKNMKGNFIVLMGGALLKINKDSAMMDEKLIGFLDLNAHYNNSNTYEHIEIFKDTKNGQFELYTCSTDCMKKLLCGLVDTLSQKLK